MFVPLAVPPRVAAPAMPVRPITALHQRYEAEALASSAVRRIIAELIRTKLTD